MGPLQRENYDSDRYQAPVAFKAEHAFSGKHREQELDANLQWKRPIADILLSGLRQDLCHVLACLAEELSNTQQGNCKLARNTSR